MTRDNSLINRTMKAATDEIFNSIVKSRHQLTNFEQDELKFMSGLKKKAHVGMNSVQDKSFIMASSFEGLVS